MWRGFRQRESKEKQQTHRGRVEEEEETSTSTLNFFSIWLAYKSTYGRLFKKIIENNIPF